MLAASYPTFRALAMKSNDPFNGTNPVTNSPFNFVSHLNGTHVLKCIKKKKKNSITTTNAYHSYSSPLTTPHDRPPGRCADIRPGYLRVFVIVDIFGPSFRGPIVRTHVRWRKAGKRAQRRLS